MKKRLEAELISIAHRILKLKNKSELIQLHQETQKLYEKLSVLRFVEENFADAKPTIGQAEIIEKLENTFDTTENNSAEEVQTEPIEAEIEAIPKIISDEKSEAIIEEEIPKDPIETNDKKGEFDAYKQDIIFEAPIAKEIPEPKKETKQISLEDLLGDVHSDPIFERVQKVEIPEEKVVETPAEIIEEVVNELPVEIIEETIPETPEEIIEETLTSEEIKDVEAPIEDKTEKETNSLKGKSAIVKDSLKKVITLGLNDRVAFEKQLFGGNSEDLNRVLSQLSTFDTFEEAQEFIEDMVKPDYHNWEGKEDYAMRFMDIVEKKFN